LEASHNSKAFTNNGILFPVILQNGRMMGNWEMTLSRRNIAIINTSYFDNGALTNLSAAEEKARLQLISFHN